MRTANNRSICIALTGLLAVMEARSTIIISDTYTTNTSTSPYSSIDFRFAEICQYRHDRYNTPIDDGWYVGGGAFSAQAHYAGLDNTAHFPIRLEDGNIYTAVIDMFVSPPVDGEAIPSEARFGFASWGSHPWWGTDWSIMSVASISAQNTGGIYAQCAEAWDWRSTVYSSESGYNTNNWQTFAISLDTSQPHWVARFYNGNPLSPTGATLLGTYTYTNNPTAIDSFHFTANGRIGAFGGKQVFFDNFIVDVSNVLPSAILRITSPLYPWQRIPANHDLYVSCQMSDRDSSAAIPIPPITWTVTSGPTGAQFEAISSGCARVHFPSTGDYVIGVSGVYLGSTLVDQMPVRVDPGTGYVDPRSGAYAQWHADGNASDASPHHRNLSLFGSPSFVNDGRQGSAIRFNGGPDYAQCEITTLTNYTLSMWMRWRAGTNLFIVPFSQDTNLMLRIHGHVHTYGFQDYWDKQFENMALWAAFSQKRNVFYQYMDPVNLWHPLPLFELHSGRWLHIAVTYDHGSATTQCAFYVNGIPHYTTTYITGAGEPIYPKDFLRIAQSSGTSTENTVFDADEIVIFDRILAPDEIVNLVSLNQAAAISCATTSLSALSGTFPITFNDETFVPTGHVQVLAGPSGSVLTVSSTFPYAYCASAPGQYLCRIDCDDGEAVTTRDIMFTIENASMSGYFAWTQQITNGMTNYTDFATADGYPNLLKYATGSSPMNSDELARMSGAQTTNGLFALRFNRNTNASDVSLIVEGSNDATNDAPWSGIATNILGSWGAATNVIESGTSTPVVVTVQDTAPPATNRFLRLRVTRP